MSQTADASETRFSPAYRLYALGLLTTIYVFNFIDRQVVVILQESIREDLGLMDWQLGLLSGFAFAIFYVTMGIPIARIADRSNRNTVISISLALWSGMTALCGAAQAYWQLLIARVGVGVGEAGCSPPAHSLISDFYPPEQRGRAMSVYNMGIYMGVFVGFLAGGWINEFFDWRIAFLAVGLPGVAFAVFVRLTLREPPRGLSELDREVVDAQPLPDVARLLWSRRSFRHLSLAAGLHAFVGYGVGNWMPPFLARVHDLSSGLASNWLAPITAIGGATGALLGGWLTDKYGQGDKRWYIWIPAGAVAISVPLQLFVYFAPDHRVGMSMFIFPVVLGATYLGPMLATIHAMVAMRARAMASAVLFFVLNLIGLGLGPFLTGAISDALSVPLGDAEGLRWALVIVTLANVWCVGHYLAASRYLRDDLANAPP